jgi:hydroxyethylthiazole kinase
MNIDPVKASENLEKLRELKPLVHNITNFVVMNYTANALLAIGASPVMAHSIDEVEEMVQLAGALVLNIGTLTNDWIGSMIKAAQKANEAGIPVILDPVGAGATKLRTKSAKKILQSVSISVVRGNASEILSLQDEKSTTRGVDSTHSVDDAEQSAKEMANELGTVLAVTGPVDIITDGISTISVHNGHPMMGRVTGTGCTASAICGAFLAVDINPLSAASTALSVFGLCGELAAKKAKSPGSYSIALIDALFEITAKDCKSNCKIKNESK